MTASAATINLAHPRAATWRGDRSGPKRRQGLAGDPRPASEWAKAASVNTGPASQRRHFRRGRGRGGTAHSAGQSETEYRFGTAFNTARQRIASGTPEDMRAARVAVDLAPRPYGEPCRPRADLQDWDREIARRRCPCRDRGRVAQNSQGGVMAVETEGVRGRGGAERTRVVGNRPPAHQRVEAAGVRRGPRADDPGGAGSRTHRPGAGGAGAGRRRSSPEARGGGPIGLGRQSDSAVVDPSNRAGDPGSPTTISCVIRPTGLRSASRATRRPSRRRGR